MRRRWATPGGQTTVDVVCDFDTTCVGCNIDAGDCALDTIDITLAGHNGKPVTQNITKYFRPAVVSTWMSLMASSAARRRRHHF